MASVFSILEVICQASLIGFGVTSFLKKRIPAFHLNFYFSIFFVMIADIIYGTTITTPYRETFILVQTEGICYVLFILFLLVFFIFLLHTNLDKKSALITLLISATFFAIEYNYILIPIYERTPRLNSIFIYASTIYSACQSILLGLLLTSAIQCINLKTSLFLHSIIFQMISDIALHHFETMSNSDAHYKMLLFEGGWAGGFLISTLTIFKNWQFPTFSKPSFLSFKSIKAIYTSSLFIIFMSLLILFQILDIVKISNTEILSNFLLMFFIIFAFTNFIGLVIGEKIMKLKIEHILPIFSSQDPLISTIEYKKLSNTGWDEVDFIIQKYNDLVSNTNTLSTKVKQQSIYVAIARTTQMIAHDIRKPFSRISLLSQAILSVPDNEKRNDLLQKLITENEKEKQKIEILLQDILQVDTNTEKNKEVILIKNIIQETLDEISLNNTLKDVEFLKIIDPNARLYCNPYKVQRVLTNLINNALEAMKNNGKIEISAIEDTRNKNGGILMIIGNNGPLIDEKKVYSIFQPFVSIGKKGGSGLGLVIVEKFINEHNGKIICKSPGERWNVEFEFFIPHKYQG